MTSVPQEVFVPAKIAALMALTEHGMASDIQALLVQGGPRFGPPGALDALVRAAIDAYIVQQGWRPVKSMPSPALNRRRHGMTLDEDKIVWFEDGQPVLWQPRPTNPSTSELTNDFTSAPAPVDEVPDAALRFIRLMWPNLPLHLRLNNGPEYWRITHALEQAASQTSDPATPVTQIEIAEMIDPAAFKEPEDKDEQYDHPQGAAAYWAERQARKDRALSVAFAVLAMTADRK